jgi:hypothetical protein
MIYDVNDGYRPILVPLSRPLLFADKLLFSSIRVFFPSSSLDDDLLPLLGMRVSGTMSTAFLAGLLLLFAK